MIRRLNRSCKNIVLVNIQGFNSSDPQSSTAIVTLSTDAGTPPAPGSGYAPEGAAGTGVAVAEAAAGAAAGAEEAASSGSSSPQATIANVNNTTIANMPGIYHFLNKMPLIGSSCSYRGLGVNPSI